MITNKILSMDKSCTKKLTVDGVDYTLTPFKWEDDTLIPGIISNKYTKEKEVYAFEYALEVDTSDKHFSYEVYESVFTEHVFLISDNLTEEFVDQDLNEKLSAVIKTILLTEGE